MGLPADTSPRSWGRGDRSPAGAAGPAAFWLSEGCRAPGSCRACRGARAGGAFTGSAWRLRGCPRGWGHPNPAELRCPGCRGVRRSRGGREVSGNAVRGFFPRRGNPSPGMSGLYTSRDRLVLACWGSPAAVVSGHGAARSQRVGARDGSGCGGLRGRQAAGTLPASGTGAEPGLQPTALRRSSDQAQILPWVPALQSATPAPIAATERSQALAFPPDPCGGPSHSSATARLALQR